jgi:uncharacterized protein YceH (UPF0502 family)
MARMNISLDPVEARVIGSLMEKSVVTPDQYPLSLNALVNACNQKSSRDPVMTLSEREVTAALERLVDRYLVREKSDFGSRVTKYHYRLCNDEIGEFRFSPAERAIVCLLLLRGPQTPGELRSRAGRLFEFADTGGVEAALDALAEYPQGPFVASLPREPGRRETRYAELFSPQAPVGARAPVGAQAPAAVAGSPPAAVGNPSAPAPVPGAADRLDRLEDRVAALEAALEALLANRQLNP